MGLRGSGYSERRLQRLRRGSTPASCLISDSLMSFIYRRGEYRVSCKGRRTLAVKDITGVLIAIVVVAGIGVMVKNGTGTANVLVGAGNGFATSVKAATGS